MRDLNLKKEKLQEKKIRKKNPSARPRLIYISSSNHPRNKTARCQMHPPPNDSRASSSKKENWLPCLVGHDGCRRIIMNPIDTA